MEETLDYFNRVSSDPACPDQAIEVVDFTNVTDFTIRHSQMQAITKHYQVLKTTKRILATIFNCKSDLEFGIARMLQVFHELVNPKHIVRISRSPGELEDLVETLQADRE
jgi:hypothetical protein